MGKLIMSQINIVISVDDEHLEKILEVAASLRAAGMTVENIMPEVGVISGSIDYEKSEALSDIEGVEYVEISRNLKAI
jgi:MoaA/NifB/PqqE/SkfB family radical SAM enzyme